MESLKEKRDRLAEATSELCYCVGITCSGCEANTKTLVKYGWDACQSELLPIIEEMRGAIKSVLWVDECRCDVAWTSRDMHEPNTYCGELDPLRETLARLEKWEVGK
jgi:hypothetical protein